MTQIPPGYKEMELFGEKVVVRDSIKSRLADDYAAIRPYFKLRKEILPDAINNLMDEKPVPRETLFRDVDI